MLEELITPISDEAPCGEYLKDNRTVYRGYRNAFNMAQSSFRQLIEDPDALNDSTLVEANADNWKTLSDECEVCLQSVSKDLEILCWHAVAQLFSRAPLANLLHSLETFDYLVENFWSSLHPMVAEDKLKADTDEGKQKEWAEGRIKPLVQLVGDTAESGLLYMPLQMQPLVSDINYSKFYAAEKSGRLDALKATALSALGREKGEVTERIVTLGKIYETLVSIEQKIGGHCVSAGTQGISFRFVKESIDRLLKALRYLLEDGMPRWPLDPEQESVEQEASSDVPLPESTGVSDDHASPTSVVAKANTSFGGTTMVSAGIVASREQALNELQKIADYFLEAEPHSPIYMLLKRAIRWGNMPLPELLEELIGDNSAVQARISQLAGLESAGEAPLKTTTRSQPLSEMPIQKAPEKGQESSSSPDDSGSGLSGIEW